MLTKALSSELQQVSSQKKCATLAGSWAPYPSAIPFQGLQIIFLLSPSLEEDVNRHTKKNFWGAFSSCKSIHLPVLLGLRQLLEGCDRGTAWEGPGQRAQQAGSAPGRRQGPCGPRPPEGALGTAGRERREGGTSFFHETQPEENRYWGRHLPAMGWD